MKYRKLTNYEILAVGTLIAGIFVAFTVASLVTAEGLRIGNPFFGMKVYRTPFIGWIFWIVGMRSLDAASIVALFFIGLSGVSADAVTKMSLRPHDHPYGKLIPLFMVLLVSADSALFYFGCAGILTWFSAGLNWPAIIITVAYISSIFVFAYVNIFLWSRARSQS